MSWLIDGQQRVITLSRMMNGDEGIDIVFHPDHDEFSLANAATRNDRHWFRVAELLDEHSYRQLRRNLDGGSSADRREGKFEKLRRILDYEVPYVRMVNHSFDDCGPRVHPNQHSRRPVEKSRHRKCSGCSKTLWFHCG